MFDYIISLWPLTMLAVFAIVVGILALPRTHLPHAIFVSGLWLGALVWMTFILFLVVGVE